MGDTWKENKDYVMWKHFVIANAREIGLISIWFWVHRAILHSWGDISVLLVL